MAKPKYPNLDSVAGVNELVKIITKLDNEGRAILLRSLNTELTDLRKTQVLNALRQTVGASDAAVRAWLVKGITASYVEGANFAVKSLKAINFRPKAGQPPLVLMTPELLRSSPFLKPHLQTVNTLLSNAYLEFGSAMTGYVKGAETILNETIRRQIRSQIAEERLMGSAIRDIKKTVTETLGDRGFTALVDRGGRKWDLSRYSEMLSRTQINKAANEAVVNRNSDWGVDIFEVSAHGAEDEACASEEGKIYSLSGNSKNYPPLDGHEPPYHPNCTHNLIPRPDLS